MHLSITKNKEIRPHCFSKSNNNLDELIRFWESIWVAGGLKFNGSHWTFRLPDLYIKSKRYDDALLIMDKIKKPEYKVKAEKYRESIAKRIDHLRLPKTNAR